MHRLSHYSAVVAFLYPGYASFKTLSQRPANEADLERWLTYWCVLGCIVFAEYVAEWLVSWCVAIVAFGRVVYSVLTNAMCRPFPTTPPSP